MAAILGDGSRYTGDWPVDKESTNDYSTKNDCFKLNDYNNEQSARS
jgi:hypothetical protein